MLSKEYDLDRKDLKILDALDKMGGNATALEIGEKIKVPARTVRYRISKLMERGILLPSFMQTYERRIGLGERILIVQEAPGRGAELEDLMSKLPIFYWYIPTHGKYDGYLIHTVYDLTHPEALDDLTEELKGAGLINKCSFFEIVDYKSKEIDFQQYRPSGEWVWDWKTWIDDIEDNLTDDVESPIELTAHGDILDYDNIDVTIVRQLKIDPDTSATALSSLTDVPIEEIRERIQRLRKSDVLRGVKRAYGFVGDLLWFSCFIDINDSIPGVLHSILDMPFPGIVLIEDDSKYCIRMGLSTTDLKHFMQGFRLIRSKLNSYSFQFHLPDLIDSEYLQLFDLFDKENNCWKIPVQDYIDVIRNHYKR